MIRGWCPSLFEPMRSGDGLLVRIKPRAGGLDADTLRAVADACARHGNGVANLTGRANLQLRGLADVTLPPFADAMLALGAADAHPAAERRRNLVVSPLVGDDPHLAPATLAVARALEAGLADAAPTPLDALPGKFGFLVDGGGACGLGPVRADIALRCTPDACLVRLDGGTHALAVAPADAAAAALALARAFAALTPDTDTPDIQPRHAPRMRDLVLALGEAAVFAAAGLPAPRPAPPGPAAGQGADAPPAVGPLRYPGTTRGALAVAPAFGQTDAAALHALAALSERFGDGRVRLSPSRTLLVAGVAAHDLPRLAAACAALGLITAPDDPRLSVTTCPGRPACRSGEADTRRDAPALAALLAARADRPFATIHLSGCAKGCAHPAPAPLTLVGEPGGYGASRNARASAPPHARHASLDAAWAWAIATTPNPATPAFLPPAAPHPGTAP
ncbi:MAG: precorrin-3B synthase [Janthinobacterium lividum]